MATETETNGNGATPAPAPAATEWKHPVYPANDKYTPGIAPIKKEFILPHKFSVRNAQAASHEDDAAEASSAPQPQAQNGASSAPAPAPVKLKGAARKRARREEAAAAAAAAQERQSKLRQAPGGGGSQNKNRQFHRIKDSIGHCNTFLTHSSCQFSDCKYSHDLVEYLAEKRRDLPLATPPAESSTLNQFATPQEKYDWLEAHYSTERIPLHDGDNGYTHVKDAGSLHAQAQAQAQAAASTSTSASTATDPAHRSLDYDTCCPIFYARGFCTLGWKCRFLGAHVRVVGPSRLAVAQASEATGFAQSGLELVRDEHKLKAWRQRKRAFAITTRQQTEEQLDRDEVNYSTPAGMKALRTRKFPLHKTRAVLDYLETESRELAKLDPQGTAAGKGPIPLDLDKIAADAEASAKKETPRDEALLEEMENERRNANASEQRQSEAAASASADDLDKARIRPSEKKRLNWRGELYLAPLTTTGNLPFRRICSSFGSDIHCGEMGLAESFLHGNNSEWSLVRRWEGERIFGTQLCGGKPNLLVPVAEALKREIGDGLDFVDINCGCPIDLVYNKGAGSALLDMPTKLSKIVRGMNAVLGDTPLTIKLRTGTTAKQTTHKLFARLQTEWGVSAATLHGRSRKQRYKSDADWGYIKTCADTLRESVRQWNEEGGGVDGDEMVPIPIYGNGDVYSWQDYYERLERTGVDGEMVARGALIKPWLFTEIKERRDWDISSRERLDIVRQFASHGLTHWGSDTQGVNTTRRFLCEMLSFTHRYVPTGILEHLPARMNDRPPPFKGRDELESLLASPNSQDWVRISEMFLGKAPEEWTFVREYPAVLDPVVERSRLTLFALSLSSSHFCNKQPSTSPTRTLTRWRSSRDDVCAQALALHSPACFDTVISLINTKHYPSTVQYCTVHACA